MLFCLSTPQETNLSFGETAKAKTPRAPDSRLMDGRENLVFVKAGVMRESTCNIECRGAGGAKKLKLVFWGVGYL